MMGKRASRSSVPAEFVPRLVLLMVFFLIGAVIGSFFAANISGDSRRYVEEYLSQASQSQEGERTLPPSGRLGGVKRIILQDMVLLALVFVSAFFRPGIILVPLCLGVKGFLLSMLVTSFIMVLGAKGYLTAFLVVFLYGFITVLSLMLTSVQAFSIILDRPAGGRGRPYIDRAYYITACISMSITVVASILHVYVTPLLGRAVSTFLPLG